MPVKIEELAPGVFAALTPNSSNAGFILGDEGVFVVDAMMPPHSKEFDGLVKQASGGKEIRFLVNTHHNGDHVLGNYLFSPPAQIISHVSVRSFLAENAEATLNRLRESSPELEDMKLPLPSITFTQQLSVHWGNMVIELRHLGPAHTEGDVVAYLPQEKILFAGDLLLYHIVPIIQLGGSSLGWVDAMAFLDGLAIDRVVSGHGPLATKKDLIEVRDCLFLFREEVRRGAQQGRSKEEVAQQMRMDKYASWQRQFRGQDLVAGLVNRIYTEMGK